MKQVSVSLKGRKLVAWLPMHTIYQLGCGLCWLLEKLPEWGEEGDEGFKPAWIPTALYRSYSACMGWSADLNDWAGLRLWYKECPDCSGTGSTPISLCLRCGGEGKLYAQ